MENDTPDAFDVFQQPAWTKDERRELLDWKAEGKDTGEGFELDSYAGPTFALKEIPTSSTNYSRPRTVAAGYNPSAKTMTVVFRDGTFYNYYEVTLGEWNLFHSSFSKGRPYLNRANRNQAYDGLFIAKPRGPADVSSIDPQIVSSLRQYAAKASITQRISADQRIVRRPLTSEGTRTAANKPYKAPSRAKLGKNPATGGKNPFK